MQLWTCAPIQSLWFDLLGHFHTSTLELTKASILPGLGLLNGFVSGFAGLQCLGEKGVRICRWTSQCVRR